MSMSLSEAHRRARQQSARQASDRYVVLAYADPEPEYAVCTEWELGTWYAGSRVVAHYFCGDEQ